jgi:hypothetical protein
MASQIKILLSEFLMQHASDTELGYCFEQHLSSHL